MENECLVAFRSLVCLDMSHLNAVRPRSGFARGLNRCRAFCVNRQTLIFRGLETRGFGGKTRGWVAAAEMTVAVSWPPADVSASCGLSTVAPGGALSPDDLDPPPLKVLSRRSGATRGTQSTV